MPHSRKLLLSIALIIGSYAVWVFATDADAVLAASAKVSGAGIAVICGMSLFNYALRFGRWQGYLSRLGAHVPWKESLAYYLAGFALTTTPGKAGEAIRSVYLQNHGIGYASSLAALLTERLADLLAIILIAALGMATLHDFVWLTALLLALTLLGVLLLTNRRLPAALRGILSGRANPGRLAALAKAADMIDRTRELLGPRLLLQGTLLGIFAWGAEAWALGYLLDQLGHPIPYAVAAAIYALSMLAGAISFMPGGVGGAEAAMSLLLASQGVPAAEAVAATLVCRLCTLWLAVLIGIISMMLLAVTQNPGRPPTGTNPDPVKST